ncbi:LOW QUALITY PROTEIN: proton channel OtopLc-like [Homalodisca vitripennis]|uniref:LOW QUALITY PROTEIN: proton channel OtopLc-like n=1 Tax=Homalodisca vitripennis TaxID=197043 RepID=UPI001EEB1189|nr:LOW QUALITY PROTEIN: proton channel OtopLc-like [Homalodisca vitripennis]
MVLQLSCAEGVQKSTPEDCNFHLGASGYSKFTPSLLTNLTSKHKLWMLNQRLNPALDHLRPELNHAECDVSKPCGARPSTADEKNSMFRSSLTGILSCVYAVFIVTLGVVIYISDLVTGEAPLAETFSIYLVVTGLLYFVFLYADIRRYLNSVKLHDRGPSRKDDYSLSVDTDRTQPPSVEWTSLPPHLAVPHHYCFSKGRHSGSFYLKIGAAGFCLGHLTHSGLLLAYQIAFLQADPDVFYKCASVATLILDVLYPTYSFCQLFFIFKYSNVIINHNQELARFAMMHCIAASLCFWVWTILRETIDSLHHADPDLRGWEHISPYALPFTTYHIQTSDFMSVLNVTSINGLSCRGPTQLSEVFESFSPYLYPFTIEYSILVVGVLYIIWQNIGRCTMAVSSGECRPPPFSRGSGFVSNVVVYADCHSSNKGLFAGLIVLAGAFLSIILFFVAMADRRYIDVGLQVNAATELTLLVLLTGAVTLAYRQITRLDVNPRPVSQLDDLLLFVCIPAFFLQAVLGITPAVRNQKYLAIVTILLQVVQVLLQTPFIIDGLRRCSNSRSLRLNKPGRELVTFLIVCNVAMWITETFEIKSQSISRDYRSQFYGRVLWTMLSHLTLPLTMFYRFHSSVCLVDIWKSAYEKGH